MPRVISGCSHPYCWSAPKPGYLVRAGPCGPDSHCWQCGQRWDVFRRKVIRERPDIPEALLMVAAKEVYTVQADAWTPERAAATHPEAINMHIWRMVNEVQDRGPAYTADVLAGAALLKEQQQRRQRQQAAPCCSLSTVDNRRQRPRLVREDWDDQDQEEGEEPEVDSGSRASNLAPDTLSSAAAPRPASPCSPAYSLFTVSSAAAAFARRSGSANNGGGVGGPVPVVSLSSGPGSSCEVVGDLDRVSLSSVPVVSLSSGPTWGTSSGGGGGSGGPATTGAKRGRSSGGGGGDDDGEDDERRAKRARLQEQAPAAADGVAEEEEQGEEQEEEDMEVEASEDQSRPPPGMATYRRRRGGMQFAGFKYTGW